MLLRVWIKELLEKSFLIQFRRLFKYFKSTDKVINSYTYFIHKTY